jgi:predicted metal-dependent hydrolase
VASEFELNSLRVDSLGYDKESNSFVIVEYKRDKSFSVIDQGYAYLALLLNNKAEFILLYNQKSKNQLHKDITPQIRRPEYHDGSTLPYLGENYQLRIINNHKGKEEAERVELLDGEFLVFLTNSTNLHSKKQVKKLYEEWLMHKAQTLFEKRVKHYCKELEVRQPIRIIIKNLKSRWGSVVTKDSVINLNVNLLKAPDDVIDYTLLHELCHLKIKEHSHHFWDLLHKFMPDYKEKIDWLNINGASLVQ